MAAQEEEARKAEEAAALEKELLANDPDVKKWVQIEDVATGDIKKLLISFKIDATELRKAISKMTGTPMSHLVLEVNGHEYVEARELPLSKGFDEENDTVRWFRSNRLQRLLQKRELATINNLDKFERSSLHFTCIDGDLDLTEEAITHADFKFDLVNKQDIFGDTALHYACIMGFADIVEMMLDKQADPEIQNINRRTPTHLASEHGHSMAMRALIRSGASLRPNPGKGAWKYPDAEWLAKRNGRNKVSREIQHKKTEEKAMEEMNEILANMDDGL
jgi:hypothetical protein